MVEMTEDRILIHASSMNKGFGAYFYKLKSVINNSLVNPTGIF